MESAQNPFLDDLSRLMTSAMGVARGASEEARSFAQSKMHEFVADMDLVGRDEFEILRAMVLAQADRIAALEAKLKEKLAGSSEPTSDRQPGP